jgi:hypothetical protein
MLRERRNRSILRVIMTSRRALALAASLLASGCHEPQKSPPPTGIATAIAAPSATSPASQSPIEPAPPARDARPADAAAPTQAPDDEIVIVRPRLIDDLLVNPGIGLQTFQRFDGQPLNPPLTWSEEGPADPPTDAPARADFPASSTAYFRWFWSQIEPAPGTIDLGLIDRTIAAARAHGQTLSFRVMPYDGGHPLPLWLKDQGLRRAPPEPGENPAIFHPDYADPLYARRWGEVIAALAARYDGHPQIDTLDISSIGYWGEGNGPHGPTLPVRQGLLDAWLDAFKQTPLLVNFDEEQGMAHAVGRGAGIRLDCLGDLRTGPEGLGGWSHMRSLYPQEIVRSGVQNTWQKRPIALESCWTPTYWKQHGWDAAPILAQALRWHVSALNVKSTPIPQDQRPAFENFLRHAGYRLELRQITYPKTVKAGGMMPVHLHWFNAGVAPPYRPWIVALALSTPDATTVIHLPADVRTWLPDDAVIDAAVFVPETLAPKSYRVRVALLDPRTQMPAVRLGIDGRKPDGWYDLGWITVK